MPDPRSRRSPAVRAVVLALLLALCGSGAAHAWSFAVCGDSRDDRHGVFPRILAQVDASGMEFLLHLGDIGNTGGEKAWTEFREKTKDFRKPLRLVIGNHELYGGGTREAFCAFFGLPSPSYSFRHRNAHVAVVDDADGSLSDRTLEWLEDDLASHPKGKNGIEFIIIALHVPPRTDTFGPHGAKAGFGGQSQALFEILKVHKADLVLAGHEHMQTVEDWNGIPLVVTGGAGAPMFPFHRFGYYRIDLENGGVRETLIYDRKSSEKN